PPAPAPACGPGSDPGELPTRCSHPGCGKMFSRSDELSRHRRSHSGIKPYACSLCEKKFARSDHLSKHTKVHRSSSGFLTLAKSCTPHPGLALTEWGVEVRVFLRTFGAFTSRTFRRILSWRLFLHIFPPTLFIFRCCFRSARRILSSHLRKNQLKVDFLAFASY
uniref:C2H2-type domain-containing protein n=1 Tax=Cyclopterus lumpus TaxID=8103 RepID=A0A8C3G7L6_CYCLU